MPALFALHPVRVDINVQTLLFVLVGIIFILLIGLRHEVGGDWDRYISIYSYHKGIDLNFSEFTSGDYAYETIHWFSLNYLDGIYSTNLICALIFIIGLIRFCRTMPLPWMALFVSVHFLIIVVSMGYTRQGAAMGMLLWALVDLSKGRTMIFYIYVILGALFHKTLLVMLPIGYLYSVDRFNIFSGVVFVSLFLIAAYGLLLDRLHHMYYYYIEIKFHHSGGALIRVFMSFVTAMIFFIYRDEIKKRFYDEKLWFMFSLVSIVLLPASYFYSTFTDRLAIYFLPLQLVVLSRIPVLIESTYNRTIFVTSTIIVYTSAMFVWLTFGNHSNKWLPYQNILF